VPQHDKLSNMVDRFLAWRLPDNFAPDHYISFDRKSAERLSNSTNGVSWPVGTNLLDADQARQMLEHVLNEPTPKGYVMVDESSFRKMVSLLTPDQHQQIAFHIAKE
jgi:hypothetical protein